MEDYQTNVHVHTIIYLIDFWCFSATFSNISAISWRPVLVVEEAGVLLGKITTPRYVYFKPSSSFVLLYGWIT
jgi:hypothetical protein